MIISHEKKFIFFHIPKTGGSSLTWNLRHVADSQQQSPSADLEDGWQDAVHFDGKQHSSFRDNAGLCERHSDYFKFTFVRNPWDVVLSWYLALSRKQPESVSPENFRRFVVNHLQHFFLVLAKNPVNFLKCRPFGMNRLIRKTQTSYITDLQGNVAVDYLARYESYDQEFEYLMKKLQVTNYEQKKVNVANVDKIPYTDFYDARSKDLVARTYRKDIESFGYDF
ncbi:MAG: hypothetical protein CMJ81_16740 [Planctomycetaceae bacterium]|jgi:hypothetical protein|nr:hypothetical protein [Planctomycetaceae bacterium]MBP63835.1 hypothetical protein [Planctomycetaceae bacterium]